MRPVYARGQNSGENKLRTNKVLFVTMLIIENLKPGIDINNGRFAGFKLRGLVEGCYRSIVRNKHEVQSNDSSPLLGQKG
jgi:hypothetical protein